jgi:MoaA/NifB/PqqE/SkfB family radical SAM enzyme
MTEKQECRENSRLNDQEYTAGKLELNSYPKAVFIQMDGPCNHNCLFCSRPGAYSYFDLDEFRSNFEDILMPVFMKAERINLTGSGELLFLADARKNLAYFNGFRQAEKMFATNGTSITPKMIDFIAASGSEYTIHASIHAGTRQCHLKMTQAPTFDAVTDNLRYLAAVRKQTGNIKFNAVFVATRENLGDLDDFVKMAAEYGADKAIVYYNFVYRFDQKDMSCFFAKEDTVRTFERAKKNVEEYSCEMELELPPVFFAQAAPPGSMCREAWSQIMINSHGDVISCDAAGDSEESIQGKNNFREVWNGGYYTGLRKKLRDGSHNCAGLCLRANPQAVNDFRAHLIIRGRTEDEMRELLKGT